MNTAVLRVYKFYVGIYFTKMYLNQIYEQSLKFHHIVLLLSYTWSTITITIR